MRRLRRLRRGARSMLGWVALIAGCFGLLCCDGSFHHALAATLSVQGASGDPGTMVTVVLRLENDVAVRAIQFVLSDVPDVLTFVPPPRPTTRSANLSADASESSVGDGSVTGVLISLGSGLIDSGSGAVMELDYTIAQDALSGTSVELRLSDVRLADVDRGALPVETVSGSVLLGLPSPTPGLTSTPSGTATLTAISSVTPIGSVTPTSSPTKPDVASRTPTNEPTSTPTTAAVSTHTPTATPTDTPTNTPTCAPTGTPYCSNECFPCPTVRPNCYADACGYCFENPSCYPEEVQVCHTPPPFPCCSCATPTPADTPTPKATPTIACVGDCSGDELVTVDELVKGVNMALGQLPLNDCPQFDDNRDERCTVDELVRGVSNALQGCAIRRFVDNGDGTITDLATGLMWEKLADDGSIHDKDNTYAWEEAFLRVVTLNAMGFASYGDWRVPTVQELAGMVDDNRVDPAVDPAFHASCTPGCDVTTCSCTEASHYWSSTTSTFGGTPTPCTFDGTPTPCREPTPAPTFVNDPDYAFAVQFYNGLVDSIMKTSEQGARAVRDDL